MGFGLISQRKFIGWSSMTGQANNARNMGLRAPFLLLLVLFVAVASSGAAHAGASQEKKLGTPFALFLSYICQGRKYHHVTHP